ncbi:MAG: hypothetical protein F4X92_08325 [Gammaproteobacteria bacterium]|nr:hypothetical protein [Gammaproteobacteria bacterium]
MNKTGDPWTPLPDQCQTDLSSEDRHASITIINSNLIDAFLSDGIDRAIEEPGRLEEFKPSHPPVASAKLLVEIPELPALLARGQAEESLPGSVHWKWRNARLANLVFKGRCSNQDSTPCTITHRKNSKLYI